MTEDTTQGERRRLEALRAGGLLSDEASEPFDRLARLAARACDAPIARVSLVDGESQVFTATAGTLPPARRRAPLSHSMCRLVASSGAGLVVTDAPGDPRVADSRAVRDHGVRAYAGEPLFSPDGECLGALCVVDERPRQWTAAQLGALRDLAALANGELRLRAAVTQRGELEGRLRQVEKMEALGQLAGGIAHDFNNLITAIAGNCALARDSATAPSEELDEIARASERAHELTARLLTFARREELRPVELDLAVVARELVPLLRRLIGEHVRIAFQGGDGPAGVVADRGQLEQVIINLAVNARDAMPDGGTLTIETRCRPRPGRFVPASREEADVLLVVSDTGVGMEPVIAARAFEPFFTTKEAGNGTGLGLATVHAIVTDAGGDVRVDSAPGDGTSVTVALPARSGPPASAAPAEDQSPEAPRCTETVLVCEDEPAVRGLLERLLARHGFTVLSAGHPARALEIAQDHEGRIHALVSDMVMPDMLGTELATRVTELRPDLRVLLTSGYTTEALTDVANMPAGTAFIEKPFRGDQLIMRLREMLDGSPPGGEAQD